MIFALDPLSLSVARTVVTLVPMAAFSIILASYKGFSKIGRWLLTSVTLIVHPIVDHEPLLLSVACRVKLYTA